MTVIAIHDILIIICYNNYSNHSWVSFQGFCESYNDAFDLPHEFGNYNNHHTNNVHCMYELMVTASYIQNSLHVLLGKLSTMVN